MGTALEIGCGQADITPKVGLPLSGFIFRQNKPSVGIETPLYVRALALRQDAKVFLILSFELLGISRRLEQQTLDTLRERLGTVFSSARCVLTATHNHSAPAVCPLEGEVDPDPEYLHLVCDQAAAAAEQALGRLAPTSLYINTLRIPGLTYNRRAVLPDGRVSMAPVPDAPVLERGPVDDTLTALVFRDKKGKNQAVVIHFACHGAAVCTQFIQGDIPGEIAQRVSEIFGAPCMYLQGSTGDINPLVISGERSAMLTWMDRLMPYLKDLPTMLQPLSSSPVRILSADLSLFYVPLPARPTVMQKIRGLELIVNGDMDSLQVQESLKLLSDLMNFGPGERPDPSKAAFCAAALTSAEHRTLAAIDAQQPLPACPLRVSLMRIGQVVFAFVAAELFAITGYQIRAQGKGFSLLPVTYAGPIVGYIPDPSAIEKGGYEVKDAWRFYRHPAPFQPDTEQRVIDFIHAMAANI